MPILRHKRWKYATPLAPLVAVCASGRVYRSSQVDSGCVDVPYQADVEELLNPPGDRPSEWEVAWECYGVMFDGGGKAIASTPCVPAEPAPAREPDGLKAVEPAPARHRGRHRKS